MTNAVLYSGGKDSTLSLHKAIGLGAKVDLLITMVSRNASSYMFHHPNIRPTRLQAESMGIRQAFHETEGRKEEELKDLENVLKENDVRLLVTGATYSRYQADRIDDICKRLGIEHLAPIWHIEPMDELRTLEKDFDAIITSVAAEGLDESFLGKRIDDSIIKRLQEANKKHGINMLFEGGEAESFVLDAPLFRKRIEVLRSHVEWKGNSGAYIIDDARLADK